MHQYQQIVSDKYKRYDFRKIQMSNNSKSVTVEIRASYRESQKFCTDSNNIFIIFPSIF